MERGRTRWRLIDQLDEWLKIPMLVLSLIWLAIVVAELAGAGGDLLLLIGTIIWVLFLIEFVIRFLLAPDKGRFLARNWLTVLALLVPALRLLRAAAIFRAARVLRGVRLVRIVGTANRSMNALRTTLRRRGFGYVLGLTLVVIGLGAAGMLSFDGADQVEGGFAGYGEAFWWTGMLVAGLGTDYWPVTQEGRILSSLLALYGLGMFGYIAATFASFFIGRDARSPRGEIAGERDIAALRAEIEGLRRVISELRSSPALPTS